MTRVGLDNEWALTRGGCRRRGGEQPAEGSVETSQQTKGAARQRGRWRAGVEQGQSRREAGLESSMGGCGGGGPEGRGKEAVGGGKEAGGRREVVEGWREKERGICHVAPKV